ncbi:MAG: hypothetical protein LBC85_10950 [Fibromonadaceae bacterium]|jgi:tetratricopeptide (TPR) repeat protein|nr:hypothetical protein [Fibromonadaceae bacterium]
MNAGLNVSNLKKMLDKKPKSLIFACLADELRTASAGSSEKLDEALAIVNKGLLANPGFLQGRVVRGRILFEKEDYTGARIDFEHIAEKDPFCLTAQKLLLETLIKLDKAPHTEVHAKILSSFEPEMHSEMLSKVKAVPKALPKLEPEPLPLEPELIPEPPPPEPEPEPVKVPEKTVDSILDDILKEEEEKEEIKEAVVVEEIKIEEIKETEKVEEAEEVAAEEIVEIEEIEEVVEEVIEEDIETKLRNSMIETFERIFKGLPSPAEPVLLAAPNIDDILKEQLASKIENLPDLTSDIDALLASVSEGSAAPEAPVPAPVQDLDSILKEQLASKMEDLPDLTSDIDALLASMPASEENAFAQNPTPTLAELYLSQNLPQKAADVYKELLARDPNNLELQIKLSQAEAQIDRR